jgi:hypothetical protein
MIMIEPCEGCGARLLTHTTACLKCKRPHGGYIMNVWRAVEKRNAKVFAELRKELDEIKEKTYTRTLSIRIERRITRRYLW